MKATYHFMTGRVAVTKTFEADTKPAADALAVEFGKSKKGVVRIQCDATRKHLWEDEKQVKKATADPEAALDVKADPDADPPTPSGSGISTTIGVAAKGAVASTFLLMLCLLFGINAKAYTYIGVLGQGASIINSANGSTNFTSLATNGYYSQSIVGVVAGNIVTNLVPLNAGLQLPGNNITMQFTSYAQTNGAAGLTNIAFGITEANANAPLVITTNSIGALQSTWPRSTFATVNLSMVGASTTVPSTTNVTYTIATTPAFTAGVKLYLENITVSGATTAYATNYTANVSQN